MGSGKPTTYGGQNFAFSDKTREILEQKFSRTVIDCDGVKTLHVDLEEVLECLCLAFPSANNAFDYATQLNATLKHPVKDRFVEGLTAFLDGVDAADPDCVAAFERLCTEISQPFKEV